MNLSQRMYRAEFRNNVTVIGLAVAVVVGVVWALVKLINR